METNNYNNNNHNTKAQINLLIQLKIINSNNSNSSFLPNLQNNLNQEIKKFQRKCKNKIKKKNEINFKTIIETKRELKVSISIPKIGHCSINKKLLF